MEDTTTVGSEAPDTGIPQGEQPGADTASIDPRQGEETPSNDEGARSDRSRDEGGRFAPKPARSLEELADSDASSWTKEERAKLIKAGRSGINTEAEYQARYGSGKTADAPAADPSKPAEGKPAAEKPTDDKGNPLAAIIQAIHPNLDPAKPEEAVRSIKELQGAHTKATQAVRDYETRVLPEIQEGIVSRLKKGPEGVRELFQQMQVELPAWLPQGGAPAPAQPAAEAQGLLTDLRDDDFLQGSQIKAMVPALIQEAVKAALAEADKKYGTVVKDHETIKDRLTADAKAAEIAETRKVALQDAQLHSDFWGEYEASDKLKDKAEKIWADSVNAEGRLKSDPHPEWPKLEKILKARRSEFLEGKTQAASYEHFLYEKLHKSGKFQEYLAAKTRNAKVQVATAQQRRVQPAIAPTGAAPQSGIQGLRVPKSVEDIQNASPEERNAFLKQLGLKRKAAVS